jgi:hypothetical protein
MESADYRLHVAAAAIIARNARAPCPMLPDGLVCRVSSLTFSVVLSARFRRVAHARPRQPRRSAKNRLTSFRLSLALLVFL